MRYLHLCLLTGLASLLVVSGSYERLLSVGKEHILLALVQVSREDLWWFRMQETLDLYGAPVAIVTAPSEGSAARTSCVYL